MGDEKLLNPSVIDLEGKAQVGMVESVELADCDAPRGWKRIIARLRDGGVESTGCMDEETARRNYMVLLLYSKRWGRAINPGEGL